MSQHEDFLTGFGDVLGLSDPTEILFHYRRWIRESDLSPIEIIDLESPGYQAGLEVGNIYKEENVIRPLENY
jgi:hypothetical protein